MKNTLTYAIPFSFKGETLRPCCTIDLDAASDVDELSALYDYLAEAAGIDPYSYEHDVMMMGAIEFDNAQGLAADFLHENSFDIEAFRKAWSDQRLHDALQQIASEQMNIEDIAAVPGLKEALQQAYQLGRRATDQSRQFSG